MSSGWAFVSLHSVNSFVDCSLPATRQSYGKRGSIRRPFAFCLNSSWLCLSLLYLEGQREQKGERQSHRQGVVLNESKETQKLAFHLVTATSQRKREGMAKLRERES